LHLSSTSQLYTFGQIITLTFQTTTTMSKPQDHNLTDSLLLSGRVVKRTNNTLTTGVPQGLHILVYPSPLPLISLPDQQQVGPRRKIGLDYIYGLVASTITDVERKNMASQGVG
jgi:hypothetical protein